MLRGRSVGCTVTESVAYPSLTFLSAWSSGTCCVFATDCCYWWCLANVSRGFFCHDLSWWSLGWVLSILSFVVFRMTLLNTFHFGSVIKHLTFQSSGTSSSSQIFLKMGYSMFTVVSKSTLKIFCKGYPLDTLWSDFFAVAQLSHYLLMSSLFGAPHYISSYSAASKMSSGIFWSALPILSFAVPFPRFFFLPYLSQVFMA